MATWYIAKSLEVLRGQLNTLAPQRSKVSDGGIGDPAHSARTSDHNPTSSGQVCARDFTHDPRGGLDCHWLADMLVRSGDGRIKYIIWNRRIFTPGTGWRTYTGANDHTSHLHLSVKAGMTGDGVHPWLGIGPNPQPAPEAPDMTPDQTRKLDALHEQLTASRTADQYPGWPRIAPKTVTKATLVDFVRQSYEDLQVLKATTVGLTAAVAALSNDQDITLDEVERIVREAVQQSIKITGSVQVGPADETEGADPA